MKNLKNTLDSFNNLYNSYEDIAVLLELATEENDEDSLNEASTLFNKFSKEFESYKISTLLDGPYDSNSAVLSLNAGAGGTEACDWVAMLLRMYTRWAGDKNYDVQILDYLDGDEAGVKSVTLEIEGKNAYGYLRSEKGVHRLIRLSPFDTAKKRHTSFASCSVMPVLEDDIEVDIKEEDLRIDTFRAGGAGGQHVNKTESAIRITHIPTGIVVSCQNERSQHKNRDSAMKVLKSKLFERNRQEQADAMKDIKGAESEIAWGSQIRTYVMHPYSMVKDHRTNEEVGAVGKVMDGDIDVFINAYLRKK